MSFLDNPNLYCKSHIYKKIFIDEIKKSGEAKNITYPFLPLGGKSASSRNHPFHNSLLVKHW